MVIYAFRILEGYNSWILEKKNWVGIGKTEQRTMMSGGVNLVMTVIGFAVSTMFIVFVCTRLICARIQLNASRRAFVRASRSDLSIVSSFLITVTSEAYCFSVYLICHFFVRCIPFSFNLLVVSFI